MVLDSERDSFSWFAMCAYRRELKAHKELLDCGIESFVPLLYRISERRGRISRVLVPAIPTFVFVRSCRSALSEFKQTHPYLQYVTRKMNGSNELLIIRDEEMKTFIEVAKHYEEDVVYYRPEEVSLAAGSRVRIHGGVFSGVEGRLLRKKGRGKRRVLVSIADVTTIATTEINPDFIELLD